MKPKPLPDAAHLRECFSYNVWTGELVWKKRPRVHFRDKAEMLRWNKRWAETVAGTRTADGYIVVNIDGQPYKAQRVIWVIQTGREPNALDHKNGNPSDNRWSNLREATVQQNRWNGRHTVTPLRGVVPYVTKAGKRRYMGVIARDRKVRYIGAFDTPEQAHEAWCAVARKERGEFFRDE